MEKQNDYQNIESEEEVLLREPVNETMVNTRLKKRTEKQTKRNVLLTIIGTIILLVVLILFGIPLLVNFSLLVERSDNESSTQQNEKTVFIAPPLLDPLFEATNSATTTVTGTAGKRQKVKLFVNNEAAGETSTNEKGEFRFRTVKLDSEENLIKAQAIDGTNKSKFSNQLTVMYKKDPPKLDISYPSSDQSFSGTNNPIVIKGITDQQAKVTVNGFWAIMDSEGNFEYTANLNAGDNTFKITSIDQAGNKAEKELKISYSP